MAEEELVSLIRNLTPSVEESRRETREQFERVDGRFTEIDGRLERVEGEIRQAHVQIEGLRGDIKQVSEGVSNIEEKGDRHAKENERQFDEVRATIQLSHSLLQKRDDDLDARLTVLETSRR